ncbi:MAG: EAL domain-containing protein [Hyphomicrobium sp.]
MASPAPLQSLHDLGVEIALDDFGTGFASLSHLKKLPIDRLKVDRSFVRDMETNPDNMAIVRTIAHLGQSLGIKVTVEGVESISQLTLLRAMGCDTMQGYLFRPADAQLAGGGVRRRGTGAERLTRCAASAPGDLTNHRR